MSNTGITDADRVWTRWTENRPPNEAGSYRYRVTADILGLAMQPEWTEKMHLCGMGLGESEWWPLSSCYWDGYRRFITHEGLEWSDLRDDDPEGVVWNGLELDDCPFTGARPTIETSGKFIGAPLWQLEALRISSPAIPAKRYRNAVKMRDQWNTRIACTTDLQARLDKAEAENERLRKLIAKLELGIVTPEWFYWGDEHDGDYCTQSVQEAVEDGLDDLSLEEALQNQPFEVSTATALPSVWVTIETFKKENPHRYERDWDYRFVEHESHEAAKAHLGKLTTKEGS